MSILIAALLISFSGASIGWHCLDQTGPSYLTADHYLDGTAMHFSVAPCLYHIWRFTVLAPSKGYWFEKTDTLTHPLEEVEPLVQGILFPAPSFRASASVDMEPTEDNMRGVRRTLYLLRILYDIGLLPRVNWNDQIRKNGDLVVKSTYQALTFAMTIAQDASIWPLIRQIARESNIASPGTLIRNVGLLAFAAKEQWILEMFNEEFI